MWCWSHFQGEAEGILLTPRGQGARESQSHEAEGLMLGAEPNGSAWPVPGEEVGHRKESLSFPFPQRQHRAVWFPQPLGACPSVRGGSVPSSLFPTTHSLLTRVPLSQSR